MFTVEVVVCGSVRRLFYYIEGWGLRHVALASCLLAHRVAILRWSTLHVTKDQSLPGFDFNLWLFDACHPISLSSRSSAAHFLTEPAPSVTIVISEQNWITWHQGQGDTLLMQGRSRRLKNVRLTFREEPRGLTHLKGLSSPSIVSSTFCLFSAASALLLSISSFIFLFSSWQRQMC